MSTTTALDELHALLGSGHTLVYLVTAEEARWERNVRGLAKRARVAVLGWSETRGLEGSDAAAGESARFGDARALLEHIATVEAPTWFVLRDFHRHLGDSWIVRRLRELAELLGERRSAILLLSSVLVVPAELEREVAIVELPLPDGRDLRPLVKAALARWRPAAAASAAGAAGDADPGARDLAERIERALLGLTERAAARVLARAFGVARAPEHDVVRAIVAEKRRVLARSELLEFVDPGLGLGDVGGLDELKRWIERRREAFGEAARARGLPTPAGLLLLGVQGCGKSLASRAIADCWGFPLVRLDLSAVIRAERQGRDEGLKRALVVAEKLAPVVLWVDELEKGFADAGGEGEGAVARALATFLTWMQEKKAPVFVAATANRVDRLPAELVRKGRFDEIFFVDLPTLAERRQILAIHLAKRRLDPAQLDLATLARASAGLTGSEIEQAVLAACYETFADGREPGTKDVLVAMKGSVPLAVTMAEQIDQLREWAEKRARPACLDNRLKDMIAETLADVERPATEDA
ncbi:MAG: AAA family ATPase [bacterium]